MKTMIKLNLQPATERLIRMAMVEWDMEVQKRYAMKCLDFAEEHHLLYTGMQHGKPVFTLTPQTDPSILEGDHDPTENNWLSKLPKLLAECAEEATAYMNRGSLLGQGFKMHFSGMTPENFPTAQIHAFSCKNWRDPDDRCMEGL